MDYKDYYKTLGVSRKASDDEPFAALAFKLMNDPHKGAMTFIRVYSGHIKAGDTVWNAAKGKKERAGRLLKMQVELGAHDLPRSLVLIGVGVEDAASPLRFAGGDQRLGAQPVGERLACRWYSTPA